MACSNSSTSLAVGRMCGSVRKQASMMSDTSWLHSSGTLRPVHAVSSCTADFTSRNSRAGTACNTGNVQSRGATALRYYLMLTASSRCSVPNSGWPPMIKCSPGIPPPAPHRLLAGDDLPQHDA
jgi:hypothetical protein